MTISIDQFHGDWILSLSSAFFTEGSTLKVEPIFDESGQPSTTQANVLTESTIIHSAIYELKDSTLNRVYEESGKEYRNVIALYEEAQEGGAPYRGLYGVVIELDPREVVVWGAEEDDGNVAEKPSGYA